MMKAFLLAALLMSGCSMGQADVAVGDAQQSLKNYGLSRCLLEALPTEETAMRKDLTSASRAYHFMGKGVHQILQDEESLHILHDPYQETRNFVLRLYAISGSAMKADNGVNVFHTCLTIYNSPEFDQFIRSQDAYLP